MMSQKRNLPSWLDKGESNSHGPNSNASNFSNLLEGVAFVLSGFVNPERSVLRSQALEMGAEYQPDWRSDSSTLLICAFPNTPKFRQVQADCGTIVSKEWISECYSQKKLVDIEAYFMHAGKPWRKGNASVETSKESNDLSPPRISPKKNEGLHSKPTTSVVSKKNKASTPVKARFSPSTVKNWAIDDLRNTLSWLESQDEKPEPSDIQKIATEGILTCLQDAIDSLEQKQDVSKITEQWSFVPQVVEELAKLDGIGSTMSKQDIYKQAKEWKRIYEMEFESSLGKKKRPSSNSDDRKRRDRKGIQDKSGDESDDTIEMTEEEIDLAYGNVSSRIRNH